MDKETRPWVQALSYVFWPVALICILVVDDKDKTLQYHMRQGLVFGAILSIAVWILNMIFWIFWIGRLLWLVGLVLAIMYAVKAYNGELFKIPLVSDVTKKIWKN